MPLPTPNLDNRSFQDIVDEAKRLIPQYCPEWTDHNVSDPGVALVELFAWMTEMVLYRVNQVPDKNYIKFLEILGIRLDPPRSARARVTFYLSAPQQTDIIIPQETETATLRTETAPAIVFTTEADLVIQPPVVLGAYTHSPRRGAEGWVQHDLNRLTLPGQSIILFPNPPVPDDAFYVALEKDHSDHVLALNVGCKTAGGAGVDPSNPPLKWQVWQGNLGQWADCALEHDGTGGFNLDGEIVLNVPAMTPGDFAGLHAYWLRCRLTEVQASSLRYEVSPEFERHFRTESKGGTVGARHATTVSGEIVGVSDGSPGQTFKLLNTPVLAREALTDYLSVEVPGNEPERWREVADFGDTGENDRCFTLDSLDGTLALGPALLQPDGSVYRFGSVPPKGSVLRFTRYQHGGGFVGNVSPGAISVPKTSIPYVASVTNRERALGGRDAQSLEDAKLKAARYLRSPRRAVTADDFEFHATQVPGISRACCLAPGEQPGDAAAIKPGHVFLIVLPQIDRPERPQPEMVVLSEGLRQGVLEYLRARCVLGVGLEVRLPEITWVSVTAELMVSQESHLGLMGEVQQRAETELYRYLNPYTGGVRREGWPFGRDVHLSEIYGILQKIPSVEYVEAVRVEISQSGVQGPFKPAPPRVVLPRHGMVCSARHEILVRRVAPNE